MDHLETRPALRELVELYASYADRRRDADIAGLFTADGALVIQWADRPPTTVRGRDDIAATMKSLDRYRVTQHVVANQLLDLAADPIRGETYCTASHVYDTDTGPRIFVMRIRYQDTFVQDDAEWRFQERLLTVDWTEDRPLNG
ncbi:nuclear transport factor 2 family protein [Nocardia sp. NBC_00511]|uniref:nuclear transport factor 2 family protein n=1 Tax=Nocardia sp. NBC_00511 TaxID=2903591 RepID=UPI0030E16854